MSKARRARYGNYAFRDTNGKLYARVQLRNEDGKLKVYKKRAINLTHVQQLAEEILSQYKQRGQAYIDGYGMTFESLAEWYKTEYVTEPIYIDGVKIEGMRTWESERNKIDRIVTAIGKVSLIAELDESSLRKFRKTRIAQGVAIATINRDFESIRAMMRKAKKMKWLKEVPDFDGFIQKGLENRRTVTITDEQEKRILAEAHKVLNTSPRLYPLIISLRDSGARPNELYPVNDNKTDYSQDGHTFYEPIRWRDVLDDEGKFRDLTTLVSFKGNGREVRLAIVSDRMKVALKELQTRLQNSKVIPDHAAHPDNLIFPYSTFKKSWQVVREAAGLPGLRLRDLRRDWVTRLGRLGYSDKLAQRGAGHKKMQTSFEYTEFDEAAALQAKMLIDKDNQG